MFPLISVLFIIGTVAITQQLMHNYFSFKNLLPIFISALYNYQDIYSFHSCSESDNFCVFCPHWQNKYFVLSTFYTFYLHTIIDKEGFLLMQKQQIPLKNSLILLLAAIIWGIAFVAQSVGMDYVGGFTFNAARSLIGSAVLVPLILVLGQKNSGSVSSHSTTSGQQSRKDLIIGGISCGICLCLASNFQQFGIKYTTVGKAGFITACYIVIVPVIGLFLGKKCSKFIWAAVVMSLVGLYLLCITDGFSVGKGDLLVLVCAFLFSVHILVIDHFSPKVDGVKLSCIQFLTCGILSGIPALLFEHPELSSILAAWQPILYAGVMSCGVAYTLQIIGQKNMNPTVASLILSLESCISVLAGWVLLGQQLSAKEILGCVIMFAAIILAQLPQKQKE